MSFGANLAHHRVVNETTMRMPSRAEAMEHLGKLDWLTYVDAIAVGDTPTQAASVVKQTFGLTSLEYLDMRRAGVPHQEALIAILMPGASSGYALLRERGFSHIEAMSRVVSPYASTEPDRNHGTEAPRLIRTGKGSKASKFKQSNFK